MAIYLLYVEISTQTVSYKYHNHMFCSFMSWHILILTNFRMLIYKLLHIYFVYFIQFICIWIVSFYRYQKLESSNVCTSMWLFYYGFSFIGVLPCLFTISTFIMFYVTICTYLSRPTTSFITRYINSIMFVRYDVKLGWR